MLFGTAQFALVLALLLRALSVLPRGVWNGVLLGTSLVFYGLWLPAYLPLLLIDIGVNYLFLRQILASPAGGRARGAGGGSRTRFPTQSSRPRSAGQSGCARQRWWPSCRRRARSLSEYSL